MKMSEISKAVGEDKIKIGKNEEIEISGLPHIVREVL